MPESVKRAIDDQLHESEQSFRLLVESVREYAIFMLDVDGHVRTWNSGAELIKGYRRDEIVGKSFHVFYTAEDRAAGKPQRLLAQALREGRSVDEGWRVRKDGSRFWASVVLTAMFAPSGEHIGFAKVTRDQTAHRQSEDERLRLAHAEEAVRLRDEFLSIASHELRTPLTSLQLQLQSVQEKLTEVDPKLAAKVGRAARSGERLAELIESLLDVSRIASGRFALQTSSFELGEILEDTVEAMRDAADAVGCALSLSRAAPITGCWDRVRVEQLVGNLLVNAIKYGAGAPVRVTVEPDGADAVIQVCDGGPGIPEKDLPRLFRRFERAVSARHYGGLGLGLYIAREIAEAHGGAISVSNQPAGGACFRVTLPLAAKDPG